jgi:hypothetical protein
MNESLPVPHTKDAMAFLFDQRGQELRITDDVVIAAGKNQNAEAMALLFRKRGNQIKVTRDVVMAAARNADVIALLTKKEEMK